MAVKLPCIDVCAFDVKTKLCVGGVMAAHYDGDRLLSADWLLIRPLAERADQTSCEYAIRAALSEYCGLHEEEAVQVAPGTLAVSKAAER
jgi:hypothetical protein